MAKTVKANKGVQGPKGNTIPATNPHVKRKLAQTDETPTTAIVANKKGKNLQM